MAAADGWRSQGEYFYAGARTAASSRVSLRTAYDVGPSRIRHRPTGEGGEVNDQRSAQSAREVHGGREDRRQLVVVLGGAGTTAPEVALHTKDRSNGRVPAVPLARRS